MEATSDYGRPVFYLLEAHGLQPWLVNARDVRHLPGRPKTDVLWLCKVAERQMLRPSFVPPRPIRKLRDLTRYRVDLVGTRTAEKNRVEKLLEDACIKLSVVASDIFGVSGRAMMAALIAGERGSRPGPVPHPWTLPPGSRSDAGSPELGTARPTTSSTSPRPARSASTLLDVPTGASSPPAIPAWKLCAASNGASSMPSIDSSSRTPRTSQQRALRRAREGTARRLMYPARPAHTRTPALP